MATVDFDAGKREIKFVGTFIFNELLLTTLRWLKSKKFVKSEEDDLNEEFYIQEDLPNGAKNVSIKWSLKAKDGDFLKSLTIIFNAVAIKKVEIMYENRKVEAENGEINISISGKIEFDPDEKLKSNFFMEKFFKYIWWPLNKKHVKQNFIDFAADMDKLYKQIQVFFELEKDKIADTGVMPRGFKT